MFVSISDAGLPFYLSFELNKLTWTHCQNKLDLNHLLDSNTAQTLCPEANPCNKSHPSLCYSNTNYIIGSSSWRHSWDCRGMSASIPRTRSPNENGKCVWSGGGRPVFALVRRPGDSLFKLVSFYPRGQQHVRTSNTTIVLSEKTVFSTRLCGVCSSREECCWPCGYEAAHLSCTCLEKLVEFLEKQF